MKTITDLKENKIVHEEILDDKLAKQAFDFSLKQKVGFIAYKNGKPFTRKKGLMSKVISESQGMPIELITREELSSINKVFVGSIFKGKIKKAEEAARFLYSNQYELAKSSSRSLEFSPLGVHKAAGLTRVANHLKIKPEEFIVFGDGGNDVEMFKWAGQGIAMGNALPELRKHATKVIGDNNTDDIAKVLKGL